MRRWNIEPASRPLPGYRFAREEGAQVVLLDAGGSSYELVHEAGICPPANNLPAAEELGEIGFTLPRSSNSTKQNCQWD